MFTVATLHKHIVLTVGLKYMTGLCTCVCSCMRAYVSSFTCYAHVQRYTAACNTDNYLTLNTDSLVIPNKDRKHAILKLFFSS